MNTSQVLDQTVTIPLPANLTFNIGRNQTLTGIVLTSLPGDLESTPTTTSSSADGVNPIPNLYSSTYPPIRNSGPITSSLAIDVDNYTTSPLIGPSIGLQSASSLTHSISEASSIVENDLTNSTSLPTSMENFSGPVSALYIPPSPTLSLSASSNTSFESSESTQRPINTTTSSSAVNISSDLYPMASPIQLPDVSTMSPDNTSTVELKQSKITTISVGFVNEDQKGTSTFVFPATTSQSPVQLFSALTTTSLPSNAPVTQAIAFVNKTVDPVTTGSLSDPHGHNDTNYSGTEITDGVPIALNSFTNTHASVAGSVPAESVVGPTGFANSTVAVPSPNSLLLQPTKSRIVSDLDSSPQESDLKNGSHAQNQSITETLKLGSITMEINGAITSTSSVIQHTAISIDPFLTTALINNFRQSTSGTITLPVTASDTAQAEPTSPALFAVSSSLVQDIAAPSPTLDLSSSTVKGFERVNVTRNSIPYAVNSTAKYNFSTTFLITATVSWSRFDHTVLDIDSAPSILISTAASADSTPAIVRPVTISANQTTQAVAGLNNVIPSSAQISSDGILPYQTDINLYSAPTGVSTRFLWTQVLPNNTATISNTGGLPLSSLPLVQPVPPENPSIMELTVGPSTQQLSTLRKLAVANATALQSLNSSNLEFLATVFAGSTERASRAGIAIVTPTTGSSITAATLTVTSLNGSVEYGDYAIRLSAVGTLTTSNPASVPPTVLSIAVDSVMSYPNLTIPNPTVVPTMNASKPELTTVAYTEVSAADSAPFPTAIPSITSDSVSAALEPVSSSNGPLVVTNDTLTTTTLYDSESPAAISTSDGIESFVPSINLPVGSSQPTIQNATSYQQDYKFATDVPLASLTSLVSTTSSADSTTIISLYNSAMFTPAVTSVYTPTPTNELALQISSFSAQATLVQQQYSDPKDNITETPKTFLFNLDANTVRVSSSTNLATGINNTTDPAATALSSLAASSNIIASTTRGDPQDASITDGPDIFVSSSNSTFSTPGFTSPDVNVDAGVSSAVNSPDTISAVLVLTTSSLPIQSDISDFPPALASMSSYYDLASTASSSPAAADTFASSLETTADVTMSAAVLFDTTSSLPDSVMSTMNSLTSESISALISGFVLPSMTVVQVLETNAPMMTLSSSFNVLPTTGSQDLFSITSSGALTSGLALSTSPLDNDVDTSTLPGKIPSMATTNTEANTSEAPLSVANHNIVPSVTLAAMETTPSPNIPTTTSDFAYFTPYYPQPSSTITPALYPMLSASTSGEEDAVSIIMSDSASASPDDLISMNTRISAMTSAPPSVLPVSSGAVSASLSVPILEVPETASAMSSLLISTAALIPTVNVSAISISSFATSIALSTFDTSIELSTPSETLTPTPITSFADRLSTTIPAQSISNTAASPVEISSIFLTPTSALVVLASIADTASIISQTTSEVVGSMVASITMTPSIPTGLTVNPVSSTSDALSRDTLISISYTMIPTSSSGITVLATSPGIPPSTIQPGMLHYESSDTKSYASSSDTLSLAIMSPSITNSIAESTTAAASVVDISAYPIGSTNSQQETVSSASITTSLLGVTSNSLDAIEIATASSVLLPSSPLGFVSNLASSNVGSSITSVSGGLSSTVSISTSSSSTTSAIVAGIPSELFAASGGSTVAASASFSIGLSSLTSSSMEHSSDEIVATILTSSPVDQNMKSKLTSSSGTVSSQSTTNSVTSSSMAPVTSVNLNVQIGQTLGAESVTSATAAISIQSGATSSQITNPNAQSWSAGSSLLITSSPTSPGQISDSNTLSSSISSGISIATSTTLFGGSTVQSIPGSSSLMSVTSLNTAAATSFLSVATSMSILLGSPTSTTADMAIPDGSSALYNQFASSSTSQSTTGGLTYATTAISSSLTSSSSGVFLERCCLQQQCGPEFSIVFWPSYTSKYISVYLERFHFWISIIWYTGIIIIGHHSVGNRCYLIE
ncbi:hypothetical protein MBLNU459_g7903t5 [Dothideomycetes sp. NU459]